MNRWIGLSFIGFLFLASCSKRTQRVSSDRKALVHSAEQYLGTPYRYGGTTKKGMDCSGLVYTSFQHLGITVPRHSGDQAAFFPEISVDKAQVGDLLFFKTSGSKINHSGIIVNKDKEVGIEFIHASTSKGVRVDRLEDTYWKKRLVKAVQTKF